MIGSCCWLAAQKGSKTRRQDLHHNLAVLEKLCKEVCHQCKCAEKWTRTMGANFLLNVCAV